ncbi:MAG: hypothetical protein NWR72_16465 [Bacteroidia bacterium]|nr:hypothetical protein [Bacteroidia bacterium]
MKILYPVLIGIITNLWLLPLQAQETDCRLNLAELTPIILRFNPYFSNHQWSQENRMELARLGSNRLLMITQDGCKRHHTVLTLVIDEVLIKNNPQFWIDESNSIMRKVFHDRPEYHEFGALFEDAFAEKFVMYGLSNRFNFPIGTRNFICEVIYRQGEGARIMIEMVEYIFKEGENLRRSDTPSEDDDGWIGQQRP